MKLSNYFILAIGILSIFLVSCGEKDSSTKHIPINSENILGKWYIQIDEEDMDLSNILYLNNKIDSAELGILNGDEEIKLLEFTYTVENGIYSYKIPPLDTINKNALQIYMQSSMYEDLFSGKGFIENENLVLDEDTFFQTAPYIDGAKISGSLSVSNGSFAQGMAMVTVININTEEFQATFVVNPGHYVISGLEEGQYLLGAIYIPKNHATDFLELDVDMFPSTFLETPIQISNKYSELEINLNINLEGVNNISKLSDTVAYKMNEILKNMHRY